MPEGRTLPLDRPDRFRPPPAYRDLSRDEPVARVTLENGRKAWLVTGHTAAKSVLSDARFGLTEPGTPASETPSPMSEGEGHHRFRRQVSSLLTPRRVHDFQPRIVETAEKLVAEMIASGPGANLVTSLCRPLPLTVICELLGIEIDDQARFHEWVEAGVALVVPPDDQEILAANSAIVMELWEYMTAIVDDRYRNRSAGMLGELIDADSEIAREEVVQTAITVLITGYITTANALSIGLVDLATAHGFAAISEDQIDRTVEEMLRRQSGPGNEALPRWALSDVTLAGQSIARDDLVLVRLEAANHDPSRFAEPDRFDTSRAVNHHLAFGHGRHHCLGAGLARAELRAAVQAIAAQCPSMVIDAPLDQIVWTGHPFEDGPAVIPVSW